MTKRSTNESAGTDWQTELRAGGTAVGVLLAGLVVVPNLLMQLGMNFTGAYTASVLTMLAGLACMAWLRVPLLLSTDMALAGWLVYLIGISQGIRWQQLLALSMVVSVLGMVLFLTPVGRRLPQWIPVPVREALPIGFGGLLLWMGMIQGRLILPSPAGLAMLGNFQDPLAYFGLVGIIVSLMLLAMKIRGALCYGMLITAALAWVEGFWGFPTAPFLLPEGLAFTTFQQSFVVESAQESVRLLMAGLTMLLTLGSVNWGTLRAFDLGEPEREPQLVSAVFGVSLLGSLLGSLPVTVAPASVGSIMSGGSGRRALLIPAVLLLLALFCEPVLAAMAEFPVMTVPVLTIGGLLLIGRGLAVLQASVSCRDLPDMAAAAAVVVLMPLSGSVAVGLGAGLIGWCLLMACRGHWRRIAAGTWLLAGLFSWYFLYGTLL